MGSQVKAKCICGLEKNILIGSGKLNFKKTEYFPCHCKYCNNMVEGNLKSKDLFCPNCKSPDIIPYNNKTLTGSVGDSIIARSFDKVLTNGTYKCPSCQKNNLKFHDQRVFWD
ncbi:hypothetical protein [Winogradskyella sp. SYSU M77433]|uniref:hypothetical protein n=1 Tax=Winogradskyella sp. SYSU M77433 TaxID=3042722 RepID=UPI0024815634|nr:hypothetical protein [Winogradskyella sp. SYSU M77433]MDH7912086.1 hypothetical protein [Winogradskyella sp. SYSU M77433]